MSFTPEWSAITNPLLVLLLAVAGTGVFFAFLAARRYAFDDKDDGADIDTALGFITTSELDLDTSDDASRKVRKAGWYPFWAELAAETGRGNADSKTPGHIAIIAVILLALAGGFLLPGDGAGALLAPPVGLGIGYMWLRHERTKRIHQMEAQLPDLITGLRAHLQAGSTPQDALVSVAQDSPAPLGDELRELVKDINVNVSMQDALNALADRVPCREMEFLVSSISIAINSGADLDPQLVNIQETLLQRARLAGKLASAIASVQPVEWVAYSVIPITLAWSMSDAENRSYWFSPGGIPFLIAVIALTVATFLLTRFLVSKVKNL